MAAASISSTPSPATLLLWADYFDNGNALGWTLDAGWEIGSANASTCSTSSCDDPGTDHTTTSNNKIAGYKLGGCNLKVNDPSMLYLTSPVINLSGTSGNLTLKFWRWFGLDYPGYQSDVLEAYDGTAWGTLLSVGSPGYCDNAWTQDSYNILPYKNSNFKFRFGTQVTDGVSVYVRGGMNIDDVEIWNL